MDCRQDFPAGAVVKVSDNIEYVRILAELNKRKKVLSEDKTYHEGLELLLKSLTEGDIKAIEEALEQDPIEPSSDEMEAFLFLKAKFFPTDGVDLKAKPLPAPITFMYDASYGGLSDTSMSEQVIQKSNLSEYVQHTATNKSSPEHLDIFINVIQKTLESIRSTISSYQQYKITPVKTLFYNDVIKAQNLFCMLDVYLDQVELLPAQTKFAANGWLGLNDPISTPTIEVVQRLAETVTGLNELASTSNLHRNRIGTLALSWPKMSAKILQKTKTVSVAHPA